MFVRFLFPAEIVLLNIYWDYNLGIACFKSDKKSLC